MGFYEKRLNEFIKCFNLNTKNHDKEFWKNLVLEEWEEFNCEEDPVNKLKEAADILYTETGLSLAAGDLYPLKELEDYLCSEIGCEQDVLREAFDRVHTSNMSKLGNNGKPIYNENGKVMKGPNYKTPDLTDLVN